MCTNTKSILKNVKLKTLLKNAVIRNKLRKTNINQDITSFVKSQQAPVSKSVNSDGVDVILLININALPSEKLNKLRNTLLFNNYQFKQMKKKQNVKKVYF